MKKYRKLTNEDIHEIAKKFDRRQDFFNADASAYMTARRRGILDDVCSHMRKQRTKRTLEELKDIAKKYTRRSDFAANDRGAYACARRIGVLDEVCAHMPRRGKNK